MGPYGVRNEAPMLCSPDIVKPSSGAADAAPRQ